MAIPEPFNPIAYLRSLSGTARHWVTTRAIAVNWPTWIVRQMALPFVALPCTIRTRTGLLVSLGNDPVDDTILRHIQGPVSALYFPASFEPVPPGGLLLDVGAHHGIYAIEVLRRNPGMRLVAVEPDPSGCRALAQNLSLNGMAGRAEIVEGAIGRNRGTGTLESDPCGSWGNRLSGLYSHPFDTGKGPEVRIFTVHEILRGRVPHTVKCNAEGAEFALIPQLLESGLLPRQIVLFVHPEAGSIRELLGDLASAGYLIEDAEKPATGHSFHCRQQDPTAKE